MKCNYVGNSSQSIVSVPNFFLLRKFKNIDTFSNNNPSSKNYFSEKELFGKVREMNFSHNQRNNHKEFDEYNRKRSYPRGRRLLTKISSSLNSKDFPVNVKIPEELHEYEKFTQYLNKINPEEKKNERVAEIKSNISNVIARLDPNFHKKISEESFPTQLNTLHSSSQNEFKTKINYYKILTESEKFQQSVNNKIQNLSKNNFLKKSISRDYNETQAKFVPKLTMSSDLIPKIHKILKNPLFESQSDLGKTIELKEQRTFKSSFKLDIPTYKREPITTTNVHFQLRKRKIEDENLINIEKYHSKAIKENIQQPLKTIYFEPFYN